MSNLLMIDFDYFFRNPLEGGRHVEGEHPWLYDWGHSEAPFFQTLWPARAAAFLMDDRELPRCEDYAGFWDRFTGIGEAECFVHDSNAHSGLLSSSTGDPFAHVWLYDAHHDCYKPRTKAELPAWIKRGGVSCEDWMIQHLVLGSKLHWRHPAWLEFPQPPPKWVPLDWETDDGAVVDIEFDTVSVCRSGAWVPPWCDDQFQEFIEAAPVSTIYVDDDVAPREWDIGSARARVELWKQLGTDEVNEDGHLLIEALAQKLGEPA